MSTFSRFALTNRPKNPVIRLSLIAPFLDHLERQGLSCAKPLHRVGLSYEMSKNPDIFVHSEVFYGLMNELARTAEDPFLGLHVAEAMVLAEWPVLTDVLNTSRTVGAFLMGFVQNAEDHSTSAEHSLLIKPDRAQYRIARVQQPVNSAAQSDGFGAGLYLRVFEAVASTSWVPKDVTLRTSFPEAIPRHYRDAAIEVHSEPAFTIEFPTQVLLADIVFDIAKLMPTPRPRLDSSMVSAIRAVASPLLAQGGDLGQAIAAALGIGLNEIEKNLGQDGTSLSREIKTLKCDVACDLLTATDTAIADISGRVGYSEPANFTRFFKSQLGMTPNQFRKTNGPAT